MTNFIFLLNASLCAFSADFVSEPHRPPTAFERVEHVFPEAYDQFPTDPKIEFEVLKPFRLRQRLGPDEVAFQTGQKFTADLTGQNSYGTIALIIGKAANNFEFGRAKFSFDKATDLAAYSDPKVSNQYYGRLPFLKKTRLGIRVSRNSTRVSVEKPEHEYIGHEKIRYTVIGPKCSRFEPYAEIEETLSSYYKRTAENWENQYEVEIIDEKNQVLARGSGLSKSQNTTYVLDTPCVPVFKYTGFCTARKKDPKYERGCVAP